MLTDELKARFDAEIKANKVVVYMKGNQLFPMCGFSAHVVELLKPFGAIHSVDVIAEPAVREAIKAYSNWPTLPQVYINGQFVGGCDIVDDLASRGELKALIDSAPAA
jgi:monothiol glutaredoxin